MNYPPLLLHFNAQIIMYIRLKTTVNDTLHLAKFLGL